jgi:hypothetical protein
MEAAMDLSTPKETDYTLKRARDMTRCLGRPNTAQRKLLDLFVSALVEDFKQGGPEAIAAVRRFGELSPPRRRHGAARAGGREHKQRRVRRGGRRCTRPSSRAC